jgi:hypothetical protein
MIENKIIKALKEDAIEVSVPRKIKILGRILGDKIYLIKPPTLRSCYEYAEILVKFEVKDNDSNAPDEVAKIVTNNEALFADYLSVLFFGRKNRKKGRGLMRRLTIIDLNKIVQLTVSNMGVSNFATSIVTLNASSLIKASEIIAIAKTTREKETK